MKRRISVSGEDGKNVLGFVGQIRRDGAADGQSGHGGAFVDVFAVVLFLPFAKHCPVFLGDILRPGDTFADSGEGVAFGKVCLGSRIGVSSPDLWPGDTVDGLEGVAVFVKVRVTQC